MLHIVSILDASGSMGGTEQHVIESYNSFIKEQADVVVENGEDATASLFIFADTCKDIYVKTPINEAPILDYTTYKTGGSTALLDAIGNAISKFSNEDNVIFFIETDGYENVSREYTSAKIKELIESYTKKGWDFNFVGAGLDAITTNSIGAGMGVSAGKSFAFAKNVEGYSLRNASFSATTVEYIASLKSS